MNPMNPTNPTNSTTKPSVTTQSIPQQIKDSKERLTKAKEISKILERIRQRKDRMHKRCKRLEHTHTHFGSILVKAQETAAQMQHQPQTPNSPKSFVPIQTPIDTKPTAEQLKAKQDVGGRLKKVKLNLKRLQQGQDQHRKLYAILQANTAQTQPQKNN